jgi:ppGpp synthetase/RelA/SpoT-type nucleotidyltranferase
MGMHEARAKIGKSVKELMAHWAETKSQWDDANSNKFAEKFLAPLEQDSKSAVTAMDQMTQILQQIKRECE